MSDNPYNVPNADIAPKRKYFDNDIDAKLLKRIKRITTVSIVIGVLTLISVIASIALIKDSSSLYNFLDVAIIAGLAYGIYKRSRICSTFFCFYYTIAQLFKVIMSKNIFGLLIPGLLVYFIIDGTIAIYQYHKEVKIINLKNSSIEMSP